MISKVFITGQTFGETCRYVFQELKQEKPDAEKARVLYVEGVRGHDHRLMAADFERQHQFTAEKEKPVFHGILTFPPGEDAGNGGLVEIARTYLQEIGMIRTRCSIGKH